MTLYEKSYLFLVFFQTLLLAAYGLETFRLRKDAAKQNELIKDQLDATREHQRLSVKPYLVVMRNYDFIPASQDLKQNPFNELMFLFTLTLQNTGSGPAFIDSFDLSVNGKLVQVVEGDMWKEVLDPFLKKYTGRFIDHHFSIGRKFCLGNGEQKDLLVIKCPASARDIQKDLEEQVGFGRMIIKYHSFYNEPDTYDSEKTKLKEGPSGQEKLALPPV